MNLNIRISDSISPLYHIIDNRVARWLTWQAEWIVPAAAMAAYAVGRATFFRAAIFVLAGKVMCTFLHFFMNYAEVTRVQSTFEIAKIKDLKTKVDNGAASDQEKYDLADLLCQRALEYSFDAELSLKLPGHCDRSIIHWLRRNFPLLSSNFYAAQIAWWMYGKKFTLPDEAIAQDVRSAQELYEDVKDSPKPHMTDDLKADAIYKYAYLCATDFIVHNSWTIISIRDEVRKVKQAFDLLTDKGHYANQMEKVSKVHDDHAFNFHYIHWHHPREALENMENFGITIQKYSDICPTCSQNLENEDKKTLSLPPFKDDF